MITAKRIIITGAAGFIGTHLLESALDFDASDVWGVFRYEDEMNLANLKAKFKPIPIDLVSPESVRNLVEEVQPELIFHLAANPNQIATWSNPWTTIESNVSPQLYLFQALIDLKIFPRFIITGSAAQFGMIEPSDLPVTEKTQFRPNTPYGVSKLVQEMLGLEYYHKYGLDFICFRLFNHIGPRQKPSFVVSDFARQIAEIEVGERDPKILVGNLSAKRDFTDVRDAVRAYWLLANKGISGEAYNIGTGVSHSVEEILQILLSYSNFPIGIERQQSRLRTYEVPNLYADISKLQNLTLR